MSDKLEVNIDSTSLGNATCIRNFFGTVVGSIEANKVVGGYRSLMSAAAVYGVAVHKFIDTMYKTNGYGYAANKEMLAVFNMPKLPPQKTQAHLADERHLQTTAWNVWNDRVLEESTYDVLRIPSECYWCKGTGKDNEQPCSKCAGSGVKEGPASELTFKIPFYTDANCVINLCGTIDNLGKFQGGCFAIRDFKTTSSYKQDDFISSFEMSRQLRIYTLACKLMGQIEPTSTLGRLGSTKIGSFIDAIFIKPKANDNEYLRSPVYQYGDVEMDNFHKDLLTFCQKFALYLQPHIKLLALPKEGLINGSCHNNFGKCKFWHCCKSSEQVAEVLLGRDFQRKVYNPLNFNE